MRSTASLSSGMPSGKAYMGWWGNMGGAKQKGITQYTLSPFQQRPFAGVFHGYLFNGYARLVSQAPYFVLPLGFAYGVYVWANKHDHWLNSKAGHGHPESE